MTRVAMTRSVNTSSWWGPAPAARWRAWPRRCCNRDWCWACQGSASSVISLPSRCRGMPVQIRWLKAVRAHPDVTIKIVSHGRFHDQTGPSGSQSTIAHHVVTTKRGPGGWLASRTTDLSTGTPGYPQPVPSHRNRRPNRLDWDRGRPPRDGRGLPLRRLRVILAWFQNLGQILGNRSRCTGRTPEIPGAPLLMDWAPCSIDAGAAVTCWMGRSETLPTAALASGSFGTLGSWPGLTPCTGRLCGCAPPNPLSAPTNGRPLVRPPVKPPPVKPPVKPLVRPLPVRPLVRPPLVKPLVRPPFVKPLVRPPPVRPWPPVTPDRSEVAGSWASRPTPGRPAPGRLGAAGVLVP